MTPMDANTPDRIVAGDLGAAGPTTVKVRRLRYNDQELVCEGEIGRSGPARELIADLALLHGLPTIFAQSEYAKAGGLMSYGESLREFFRRSATCVDKIIKGAKPGDLPIEQLTKFKLVINRITADALGLRLPPKLYSLTD